MLFRKKRRERDEKDEKERKTEEREGGKSRNTILSSDDVNPQLKIHVWSSVSLSPLYRVGPNLWSSILELLCMHVRHSVLSDSLQPNSNSIDCSLPGSSVHGILQARILEQVAMPSSRGSFRPRDQTRVSCISGRIYYNKELISLPFYTLFSSWLCFASPGPASRPDGEPWGNSA